MKLLFAIAIFSFSSLSHADQTQVLGCFDFSDVVASAAQIPQPTDPNMIKIEDYMKDKLVIPKFSSGATSIQNVVLVGLNDLSKAGQFNIKFQDGDPYFSWGYNSIRTVHNSSGYVSFVLSEAQSKPDLSSDLMSAALFDAVQRGATLTGAKAVKLTSIENMFGANRVDKTVMSIEDGSQRLTVVRYAIQFARDQIRGEPRPLVRHFHSWNLEQRSNL